jgi:uncharacterized protein (UPF0333 family)
MIKRHGFSATAALLVLIVLAAIGGVSYYVIKKNDNTANQTDKKATITNFDECAAAGNPVMESYPEQCSANGQTFIRDVEESSN